MDGGAPGDGLIEVDSLGEFLAVEEVLEESLDLGDTGGATDENNLVQGVSMRIRGIAEAL